MCVRSWLWGRSVQQGLINTLNDNSNPWHFLEVDRQMKTIKKKPNVGWNMTSKQILLFFGGYASLAVSRGGWQPTLATYLHPLTLIHIALY